MNGFRDFLGSRVSILIILLPAKISALVVAAYSRIRMNVEG